MKKYILLISMMALIAGCSNEETADTSSENEDSEEVARLKEENEELKRQQAEQEKETEQQEQENDASEDKSDTEPESQENKQENESDKNNDNENSSAVNIDINSPEVQNQLITSNDVNNENFEQNAIQIGMSQTEVEELYGPYDFTFYSGGASPAFYGNLAVVYSGLAPYGENNDDTSLSNIDPDTNYVESISYYAGITKEELFEAFGEPTDQNDGSKTMNGLPVYLYEGETESGRYYITGANTINTPEGERVGRIVRSEYDENPNTDNQSASQPPSGDRYFDEYYTEGFPVALTPEKDSYTYETMQGFIFITYLNSLSDYYNDKNEELLFITTGDALEQVQANKASGNFANYKIAPGQLLSAEQISEREYRVTVERGYSHATSNGEQTTQVTYTIVDTDGMLKVSEFN